MEEFENEVYLIPIYPFNSIIKEISINNFSKIIRLDKPLKEKIKKNMIINTENDFFKYDINHALIFDNKYSKGISIFDTIICIKLFKKGKIFFNEQFFYDEKNQEIEFEGCNPTFSLCDPSEEYKLKLKERTAFIDNTNKLINILFKVHKHFPNFDIALTEFLYSQQTIDYMEVIAKYCICLEAILLKGGETEGITYKFAGRLAHLISNNYSKRKEIFEFAKKLYSLRSKYIHGKGKKIRSSIKLNSKEILFTDFLNICEDNVRKAIKKYFLLVTKFKNSEEIIDYLDNLMLGKNQLNRNNVKDISAS